MIDNFSLIFFGGLIIYTVIKSVKLDKRLPWFHVEVQAENIKAQASQPDIDKKHKKK